MNKEKVLESQISQLEQAKDENEIEIKQLAKTVSDRNGMIFTLREKLERVEVENQHLIKKVNKLESMNSKKKRNRILSIMQISTNQIHDLESSKVDIQLSCEAFMNNESDRMRNIVKLYLEAQNWECDEGKWKSYWC